MEDQKKKSLSEISHLFLSSVRDNATGGTRPARIPPGGPRLARNVSVDLTPEEYARVVSETCESTESAEQPPYGAVSAIICSQFNGHQLDRAKEYARHLAGNGQRVGLIVADTHETTVTCFETAGKEPTAEVDATSPITPREMGQALEELAWDVDRWLLILPNTRTPEARDLLRKADHWVLLSTCDHDGVVSCYRAIKGLAETPRPRLTLALLNATDQVEAGKVYRKIASVCEQFLNWKMEAEPAVEPTEEVIENLAIRCGNPADRAASTAASHWSILADFITKAQAEANRPGEATVAPSDESAEEAAPTMESPMDFQPEPTRPVEMPRPAAAPRFAEADSSEPVQSAPLPPTAPAPTMKIASGYQSDDIEVTELPGGEFSESAVLNAVINRMAGSLIQCPIHPPCCPQSTIAVDREHRLVLLAVARKGLAELRAIAMAYRWMIENRPLLTMAMPQFGIDANEPPTLKLLIDRTDAGAELLLPMTEHGNITVQTYRKLRWAGKTGLLLEAA